jgi:hypothetical protein
MLTVDEQALGSLVLERDHFKARSEELAQRVLDQSALINELRIVVRHARAVVDTAKSVSPFDMLSSPVASIDESFLEALREALSGVRGEL